MYILSNAQMISIWTSFFSWFFNILFRSYCVSQVIVKRDVAGLMFLLFRSGGKPVRLTLVLLDSMYILVLPNGNSKCKEVFLKEANK